MQPNRAPLRQGLGQRRYLPCEKKTRERVGSWTQFLCHHYGQQDNMWVIDYQRFSVGNHLYKASRPLSYIMKSKIQLYSSNPPQKKACFRLPASCFLSPPSRIHIIRGSKTSPLPAFSVRRVRPERTTWHSPRSKTRSRSHPNATRSPLT